jgi:hypothetical protein
MKILLPAALLLSLAACSPPTPYTVEADAPNADPTQTAVMAYLKKTLDDPASYQPAEWGKPKPWLQAEVNKASASKLNERIKVLYDIAKLEMRPSIASKKDFDKTTAAIKRLQDEQDSLRRAVDTTQLGSLLLHAYRAKNKMGALQLDSAQFIVYKNGKVEKL